MSKRIHEQYCESEALRTLRIAYGLMPGMINLNVEAAVNDIGAAARMIDPTPTKTTYSALSVLSRHLLGIDIIDTEIAEIDEFLKGQ